MTVDRLFPYDPTITPVARLHMQMPDKLRAMEDREIAQVILEGWAATNPETAERLGITCDND